MDNYSAIRSLPFDVVASALGIDMARFKRKKDEWSGYCPIHQSKTNNSCFNYSDTGKWHCFSCGAKGSGALDLVKTVKQIGFNEAVALLKPLVGSQSTQQPPETTQTAPTGDSGALQPLAKDTWRKFTVPCPWLHARCPDPAVREQYGVFCYNNPARRSAYSGRVMLPVKDMQGNLYGYLGRAVASESDQPQKQDNPKYLFPRNLPKSHFLFGAHELGTFGPRPLKLVYVVESPFAVMKFASLGLPAVSPFGWSVSQQQIELLTQLARGIVHLPDRDKYQDCARVAGSLASRVWLRFSELPAGIEDPEHLTKEQILALH